MLRQIHCQLRFCGMQRKFPGINFLVKDPNEDFELSESTVIIDVVEGLEKVRVFDSLDDFQAPPQIEPSTILICLDTSSF